MDLNTNSGWLSTVILAAIGLAKGIWDYLKKRSDNETTVKVNEESKYKQSREELQESNDKLFEKLSQAEKALEATTQLLEQTRHDLDKSILAFKILIPLIEDIIAKNPAHKAAFDEVRKVFKTDIN